MSSLQDQGNLEQPVILEDIYNYLNKVNDVQLKFFIEDDNNLWVDFSDLVRNKGINSLKEISEFKFSAEKKGGLPFLESSISKVTLDNSHGIFNQRLQGLKTIKNTDANFSKLSKNKNITVLKNRRCKIELIMTTIDDSSTIVPLGVYIVKSTQLKGQNLTLSLESQLSLLKKADASVVKDGNQWYRYKTFKFLIKELLKTKFADEDGNLPTSYKIIEPKPMDVPSHIGKVYSALGSLPYGSNNSGAKKFIRASVLWTWKIGSLESTSDESYILTSSVDWTTYSGILPKAGDVITIHTSANGNDGEYVIKEINGDQIVLETPLLGKAESLMSYTIIRIFYVYKDRELWEHIPQTNESTYIGICNSDEYVDYSSYQNDGISMPILMEIIDNELYIVEAGRPPIFNTTQDGSGNTYIFHRFWKDYNTSEKKTRILKYNGSTISILSSNAHGGEAESSVFLITRPPIGTKELCSDRDTENLLIPFNQGIKCFKKVGEADGNTKYIAKPSSAVDGTTEEGTDPPTLWIDSYAPYSSGDLKVGPIYAPKHYYAFTMKPPIIFSWNEGPKVCYASTWGNKGSFVFLYTISPDAAHIDDWDGTEGWGDQSLKVRVYDIDADTNTYYTYAKTGYDPLGITIKFNEYNNECFISVIWIRHPETTPTQEDFENRIYHLDSSGTFTDKGYTTNYNTVLDAVPFSSTMYLFSLMRRNDPHITYKLAYGYSQGPSSPYFFYYLLHSSSPFIKLTKLMENEEDSSLRDIICYHKYENKVIKFNGYSKQASPEARGYEPINGDANMSSPFMIDLHTRPNDYIIYGISWRGEDPVMVIDKEDAGMASLWKLDSKISVYIPVADFSELNVADAIGKIAQAANYVAFFNENGDFCFLPKEGSDKVDYVISNMERTSVVSETDLNDGTNEIYNHITLIPYRPELNNLKMDITLVKRDENEPDQDLTKAIEITSLNDFSKSLRLVCVRSGILSDNPLFKWIYEFGEIEARVAEEVSTTQRQFLVYSVFGGDATVSGINTGDFVLFNNNDVIVVREIAGGKGVRNARSGTAGTNELEVYDSSIYEIGDIVNIVYESSGTKRFKAAVNRISGNTLFLAKDLPDNINMLSDAFAPIKNEDNTISLYNSPGFLVSKGSEINIVKSRADSDEDSRKAWSSDGLTFIIKDTTDEFIYVNSLDMIGANTYIQIGEEMRKVLKITPEENKIELESSITASVGDIVKVFWSPSSTATEVANSGIMLRVTDSTAYFKVGDVIAIKDEGIKLSSDDRSRKLATSIVSREKYGKLDYPTIKNRFIHYSIGEVLIYKLLEYYKFPRFHLKITIPLIPFIKINRGSRLSRFKVIDPKLFPTSKDYSRIFTVRSYTVKLKKNEMILDLVDTEFY